MGQKKPSLWLSVTLDLSFYSLRARVGAALGFGSTLSVAPHLWTSGAKLRRENSSVTSG
jgi:hypothetical protein